MRRTINWIFVNSILNIVTSLTTLELIHKVGWLTHGAKYLETKSKSPSLFFVTETPFTSEPSCVFKRVFDSTLSYGGIWFCLILVRNKIATWFNVTWIMLHDVSLLMNPLLGNDAIRKVIIQSKIKFFSLNRMINLEDFLFTQAASLEIF